MAGRPIQVPGDGVFRELPTLGLEEAPQGPSFIKQPSIRVFSDQQSDALSDFSIDCRLANAVSLVILASGTNPSADVTVEGSAEEGGNPLTLTDPQAVQTGVNSSRIIDVQVGSAWARVRLSNVRGSFTVVATAYTSPGPTSMTATIP